MQVKSKSRDFLKREKKRREEKGRKKWRKNEKREDRRTDEVLHGLASCIHSTISDSTCQQNFRFSL